MVRQIGVLLPALPVSSKGPKMKSTIEVALAIVLRRKQVLICQRLAEVHLAGFWEFPGGKILAGEPAAEAALRELREETAIEAAVSECWSMIEFEYPERRVRLHPFLCQYARGQEQALGCRRIVWADLADLDAYRFPEANAPLLRRLKRLNLQA